MKHEITEPLADRDATCRRSAMRSRGGGGGGGGGRGEEVRARKSVGEKIGKKRSREKQPRGADG